MVDFNIDAVKKANASSTPTLNVDIDPSKVYFRDGSNLRTSPFARSNIQRTHSDLRADPIYQAEAEKFLTWLGQTQGAFESVTGGLRNTDIFETLRDEEGRLGTAIDRARIMEDAPEDIKETYKYLRKEFEDSKAGSFNEIAKAAFDRGIDMFADPVNLLFALIAPGVGSAAASKAAPAVTAQLLKEAGEQSATRTLRNIATANAAKTGAFEGTVWTGIENYARQDKDISLGLQDAFSNGDFALSTGAGGVLGAGAGIVLSRLFNTVPSRVDVTPDDNINITPVSPDTNDPSYTRPTRINVQEINPDSDVPLQLKEVEIRYGPTNKVRARGEVITRINATTLGESGEERIIVVDADEIIKTFDDKPWTDPKVDGVAPLKEDDIKTPEEWVMFHVFHEADHASRLRPPPDQMTQGEWENLANQTALRELRKWRRANSIPSDPNTPVNPKVTNAVNDAVDSAFDRAVMKINPITGDKYYDRNANGAIDNNLIRTLTTGVKRVFDPITRLTSTTQIDINLPEKDAANIVYAIKDMILNKSNVPAGKEGVELKLTNIDADIAQAIRRYNLSPAQIKTIANEVAETYSTARTKVTQGDRTIIAEPALSDEDLSKLMTELSNDVGGGRDTAEMLLDEAKAVQANASPLDTPLDVKRNMRTALFSKVNRYLSTSIGGFTKAVGILEPARRFAPNVIRTLQQAFSSEVGSSWKRGQIQVRDVNDFVSYFNEVYGKYTGEFKTFYDQIKTKVKGKDLKNINELIIKAVRSDNRVLESEQFPTKISKELIVSASDALRRSLKEIGQEAQSKGLLDNNIKQYFPRLWNRDAIEKNRAEFAQLLASRDGIAGLSEADADQFINELLDIKFQFGDEHRFGGNSFFANRTIDLQNEDAFNKFIDTDLDVVTNSYFSAASKAIAKKDILNVRNREEFRNTWLPAIEREMTENGASGDQIQKAKQDADYLYRNITGEDMARFGKSRSNIVEGYMLANQMAYLPLATISSLTEIFINMSKAGVGTSFRGFRDTIMNGSQKMYYDSMDVLQKVHGLTREEAKRELNSIGIALEQAVTDEMQRLSGGEISNAFMRKVSNGFFRFTLLDQWTKTVQLTSYITGKRLITENIENLANKMSLIDSGQISRRMERQIRELADLGIDFREGVNWYNSGASLDDPFYAKVKRGGGVYTNEVILNPSAQSGLKPTYMSNPKTAVFGQLLGYPAAFTNTILKNVARDIKRNPETAFTKHIPTIAIMTGTASLLNGIRTNGEAFEDKDAFDIAAEGFMRTGANGLLADQITRGVDAVRIYGDIPAAVTGIGVVPGDIYKLARQGDIFSFLFNKIPGTGARDLILGMFDEDLPEDLQRSVKDVDAAISRSIPRFETEPRRGIYKGGEVYDVPQVKTEPDERIDRLTGFPYDIQAGEAFIDEEDRDVRGNFNEGGFILNALKGAVQFVRGDKKRAIDSMGKALGVGTKEQRDNERDAARAINEAVEAGKVPARFKVGVDDYGFVASLPDEEMFNAVNHGLLSYRYGTNALMRKALQVKEGELFQGSDKPTESAVDAFNNERGFNLRQQGLSEQEALNELIQGYSKTTDKLRLGLPLIRGRDILLNKDDFYRTVNDPRQDTTPISGQIERDI